MLIAVLLLQSDELFILLRVSLHYHLILHARAKGAESNAMVVMTTPTRVKTGGFACRLMPELLEAGATMPSRASSKVAELPPANKATLQLLLETLHRVAGNAVHNGMDAAALGTALAPYLAWLPPPKPSSKVGSAPAPQSLLGMCFNEYCAGISRQSSSHEHSMKFHEISLS